MDLEQNHELIFPPGDTPGMEEQTFPNHFSLAMAYVPYQPFENLFDEETGFIHGTIFKALNLPFYGSRRRAAE